MWGQQLPQHEWVLIPEAGHALPWEEPEAFSKAVLDFLGKQR
jgi:pimeloyl-ACP methyl ester carboxylesterase